MLCCTDIHLPPLSCTCTKTRQRRPPLHNKVAQASPQHPVYPSTIRHLKSTQRAQLPWRLTYLDIHGCLCLVLGAWSGSPLIHPHTLTSPPVLPWARFGTFHDRHLQLLLPSSIRTATPHLIAIPSRRRYLTLPLSLPLSLSLSPCLASPSTTTWLLSTSSPFPQDPAYPTQRGLPVISKLQPGSCNSVTSCLLQLHTTDTISSSPFPTHPFATPSIAAPPLASAP
ncbi:hypothetical protein BDP55DRAFT_72413 [Colletotrichum godetiae]|uniref:Uncharacterized protein n=1 Tax=Colletotrichum godetiae TaxID=1209918 RepID=A0AAJ0APC8_9PEZI|nr:uncharacterized protein BDP55DRAFT_72413 [Colletotrichum godetiae]KAK1687922.1 hypothetical protein BDP55DRAFT_72413 [Colletotrichum godetiae]